MPAFRRHVDGKRGVVARLKTRKLHSRFWSGVEFTVSTQSKPGINCTSRAVPALSEYLQEVLLKGPLCAPDNFAREKLGEQWERMSKLAQVAITHGYLSGINDAETCNLLCGQCNASGVFADGLCECSFTDNNNEECVQRIQKEIQAIDLNIISDDDSTDEERNVRSILRRRRLRFGNADNTNQNNEETAYAEYAPNVEAASPSIYPSSGLCHLTNSLLGAINPHRTHRHGLHNVLLKTAALPAHALHNLLVPHHHHHHPIYHHGIFRSAHPQTIPYGQQFGRCENNGRFVDHSVSSIAMNNADKPESLVAASVPVSVDQMQYSPQILYTYDTNVAQPAQYQPFNYPYKYVYHNPVLKILYPTTDNYYPPYIYQGTSGPIISAPNPYHYCINNANTEQPSTIQPVIGDSLYTNNETEKPKDAITDNIFKKEKKIEKDGNTKL